MEFRMKQLLSKGQTVIVNEQLDVSELFRRRKDVIATSPVHIDLKVQPEGGIVAVEGKLDIEMELACSRCLESTHVHSSIPFAEQFKPAEFNKDAELDEDENEEDDLIVVADDRLDLKLYVEEYVQLFMPFAPLCKPDCKGLCQQCGSNLNEQSCQCSNERIDPRLETLKDFFKE